MNRLASMVVAASLLTALSAREIRAGDGISDASFGNSLGSINMRAVGFWPLRKSRTDKVIEAVQKAEEAARAYSAAKDFLDSACEEADYSKPRSEACARAVAGALSALETLTKKAESVREAAFNLNVKEVVFLRSALDYVESVLSDSEEGFDVPQEDDMDPEKGFTAAEKEQWNAFVRRYVAIVDALERFDE